MDQATYNQFESLGLLSARSDPLPATHPSSAYSSSDSFPGLHATAGGANLEVITARNAWSAALGPVPPPPFFAEQGMVEERPWL